MFGLVLSPMSSISRGIEKIESMKDRDCTIIDEYIKTVRPCPNDALTPFVKNKLIGRKANRDIDSDSHFLMKDLF